MAKKTGKRGGSKTTKKTKTNLRSIQGGRRTKSKERKHPDLDPAIKHKRDRQLHKLGLEFLDAEDAKKDAQAEYNNCRDKMATAMRKKGRLEYIDDAVHFVGNESLKLKGKRLPQPE